MTAEVNPHARRAAEIETMFLAGVERRLDAARRRRLPGTRWAWTTRSEEHRLREWVTDRETLRALPRNTARILTGSASTWFFRRRRSSVAAAAVVSPLDHYVRNEGPAPPTGLTELLDAVGPLVTDPDIEHLIGVCSPAGFTAEARGVTPPWPNVTLVLITPREDGGWCVEPVGRAAPEDARWFDPEPAERKRHRIRGLIEASGADLLTRGISAAAAAERLDLDARQVADAFERLAAADPEMKLARRGDEVYLYRGAGALLEDDDMSMVERIRRLFNRQGNVAGKINTLTERRTKLLQQRDRLYHDAAKLEEQESRLVAEGKAAPTSAARRRIAAQIRQVRDDIGRLQATAQVVGRQVEVISTHVHNLTLVQQGQTSRLPSQEELADEAVRAEELLEQLGDDAALAASLAVGTADVAPSEDEAAILRELEGEPATATEAAASDTEAQEADSESGSSPEAEPSPKPREPEAG